MLKINNRINIKLFLKFLNKKQLLFALIIILYVVYHISTLGYTPLVWQDETFFNSITTDYIQNKSFHLTSCPLFLNGIEVIYYGPVFFIINSWIIEILGNNPFQARLLGLLAGICIILVTHNFFSQTKISETTIYLLIILAFLHDPFFNSSLHKGRNDTLALLFYIPSIFIILNNKREKLSTLKYIFSAVLISLSILTTIRMAVFILPPAIVIVVDIFLNKKDRTINIYRLGIWLSAIFIIYSAWVHYAFGNYQNFLLYFIELSKHLPSHLLGNLFIPIEVLVLIIISIIIFIAVFQNNIKIVKNSSIIFSLLYLATFYIFIGDVGPYSILVIPIYYFLIANLISCQKVGFTNSRKIIVRSVYCLLIFNLIWFYTKGFVIITNYSSRDYSNVTNFIKQNIPANSKVIGDEMYYYAVINNDCQFQYVNLHINDINKIENYRRVVFKYEYIILSNRLAHSNPNILNLYSTYQDLEVVGELKNNSSKLLQFFSKLGIYNFSIEGYGGKIYKRILKVK